MLKALLLALTVVVLTTSCTSAGDLTATDAATPSEGPTPSEASGSPASTPSPSAESPEPPPEEGTCRRLRPNDLETIVDDTRPVPCAERHTAVTYHVGRLPAEVAEGAASAGDDGVEAAADRMCTRRFADYVGGSRADRMLTSLRPTFFLPDSESFAAGARWVRCDLVARAGDGRLAVLPGRLEGALGDADRRARLGICSRVGPDRSAFRHIVCARDHRWRAVGRVRLGPKQAKFPGGQQLGRRASSECERVVRGYLDTRDSFSYGFEVPRREAWADGDRFGICWAQTTQ